MAGVNAKISSWRLMPRSSRIGELARDPARGQQVQLTACVGARSRKPKRAYGLLYLAAVWAGWREQEHRQGRVDSTLLRSRHEAIWHLVHVWSACTCRLLHGLAATDGRAP